MRDLRLHKARMLTAACTAVAAPLLFGSFCSAAGQPAGLQPTAAEAGRSPATELQALRESQRREAQHVEEIDAEIEANGPFSPRLFDMYYALASHYRDLGDYELAAATLENALHIQRVTHGLFSMEQAEVMRDLFRASVNSGDFDRAAALETQLMRIASENPTDVRTVPIYTDVADRQFEVYERFLRGELPPQVNFRFDTIPTSNHIQSDLGGSWSMPVAYLDRNQAIGLTSLFSARNNYRKAIGVLMAAEDTTDPRIVEFERRLVASYFLQSRSERIRPEFADGLFREGANSYARMMQYAVDADDVSVAAEALVGLADWHMLFQRFATALRLYSEAYDQLDELGLSQAQLNSLFAPEVPVALPAFQRNPLAGARTQPSVPDPEFVDVRMRLSRYGRSRARTIDTLAAEEIDAEISQRIRRAITSNRFRPILDDGEPQHGVELEFRYYY